MTTLTTSQPIIPALIKEMTIFNIMLFDFRILKSATIGDIFKDTTKDCCPNCGLESNESQLITTVDDIWILLIECLRCGQLMQTDLKY